LAPEKNQNGNSETRKTSFAQPLNLKLSSAAMGAEVDAALARNIREMRELQSLFEKEFPPYCGKTGYLLVGITCGRSNKDKKIECPLCPHSLAWRKFNYKYRTKATGLPFFFWEREPRLGSLPSAFLGSRQKSAARFRYYNDRMMQLNAQRKKLTAFRRSMQAAFRSIKVSKDFNKPILPRDEN
jgi:hypothetical protein